ncbi:MAG TPA: hypothetical protein VD816_01340, partial [Ohtaekwangia sp.]|nr:hypothetical protein [Ohtaekwangia sp.]
MKVLVGFLTETAFCCALLYGIGFSSESPYSNNASVAVRSDLARDQADAEFVVRALEQCYAISEVAMVGKITSRSADINREAETILHDYTVITDSLKAAAAKKSLCVVLGSSEA